MNTETQDAFDIAMKTMIGDFRAVKPTKADQRNNPDIDVMAAWLDDIEHTIKCKSMDEATAAAFREAILRR